MTFVHRVEFGCQASEVRAARAWTRQCLQSTPGIAAADDAELVVSELVTNAVQAGCCALTVELGGDGDCVRIAVTDDAPGAPVIGRATPDAARGRGLLIVAALATRWGVHHHAQGKQVWALLPIAA